VEITSVATKRLGLPEEISGHDARGSQYRWTILGNSHCKLYLCHFTGDTWGTGTDYRKWFIFNGCENSEQSFPSLLPIYTLRTGLAQYHPRFSLWERSWRLSSRVSP
jgi:hypothetical protein